jgi:hypothetical protein
MAMYPNFFVVRGRRSSILESMSTKGIRTAAKGRAGLEVWLGW